MKIILSCSLQWFKPVWVNTPAAETRSNKESVSDGVASLNLNWFTAAHQICNTASLRIFSITFIIFTLFCLHLCSLLFAAVRCSLILKDPKFPLIQNLEKFLLQTDVRTDTHTHNKLSPLLMTLVWLQVRWMCVFQLLSWPKDRTLHHKGVHLRWRVITEHSSQWEDAVDFNLPVGTQQPLLLLSPSVYDDRCHQTYISDLWSQPQLWSMLDYWTG